MPGRSCNALITKISQSTLGLRENELSRETVNYGGVSNMVCTMHVMHVQIGICFSK